MSTWILVHRKIFEHWVAEDKPYCRLAAWIYLISRASYEDKTVYFKRPILIKRGEFVTSYRHLAEIFGWGINKTVLFLNQLELEKMINIRSTHSYTVINICNYDNYQCVNGKIKTPIDTATDTQTERWRNAGGTLAESIKEKKKIKEDKKKDIYIPFSKLSELTHHEIEFVKLTQEEYDKLIKVYSESITNEMIFRLDNYIGSKGIKYKSHYRTILNWIQRDKQKGEKDGKKSGSGGYTLTAEEAEAKYGNLKETVFGDDDQ